MGRSGEENKRNFMKNWQFIEGAKIGETLGSKVYDGKHQLEPLSALSKEKGISFNILEDHNFLEGQPEAHRHEADLWIGIEGEMKFVVGGEMVEAYAKEGNDNEIKAKTIANGTEVVVKAGDVLLIPAGIPHAHTAVHGRAAVIKIPERDIVPLEEVPGWRR